MTASVQPKRLAIFTICSNNYLPFARVLFASARRHHPQAALFLCLADRIAGPPDPGDSAWTAVAAETLAIPDFASLAFRYDIMEFNTALKPFMFLHLLDERGFDAALYFDPDIELFAPAAAVTNALAAGAALVLTPHLCSPCEDPEEPNDIWIMRAGAYNLGFLAASRCAEALELLAWWARRLRYQCINAQPQGLFVDQKFMDLAPGYAPHTAIVRDPALNVAYWNLRQRCLGQTAAGWTVDGAPLVFFHFSGFNPHDPSRLSKHDPHFAGDLAPPLRALTQHYAEALLAAGYGKDLGPPYAYGAFASGVRIPAAVRQMFREWHPFWASDPFQTYQAFLDEAWPGAARAGPGHIVTNLMRALHAADAHRASGLDLADPADASALVRWFVNDAAAELQLDPALIQPAAARLGTSRPPAARVPPKGGAEIDVAVIAPLTPGTGAAECGRAVFHALLTSKLAVEMVDSGSATPSAAPVQILCVDGGELAGVLPDWCQRMPPSALRIVVPLWDCAQFPEAALAALASAHEVWAPSRCSQSALAGRVDCPVLHMPLATDAKLAGPLTAQAQADICSGWSTSQVGARYAARLRVLGLTA